MALKSAVDSICCRLFDTDFRVSHKIFFILDFYYSLKFISLDLLKPLKKCIKNLKFHLKTFSIKIYRLQCVLINYLNNFSCRSSQSAFYKVLIANAATSALRLHQRLPNIQFTREFLSLLLLEDSCHYLFFSLIFLYVQPFVLVLFPVVLFAVLHSASYSLKMLDVSGK